jgi:hypothetical protein
MYTCTSAEESDSSANELVTAPTFRPSNDVCPHRFVWTAILELPFGKGKRLVNTTFLQHVAGRWRLRWVYQRQSDPATDRVNRFFCGDIGDLFRKRR